MRVDERATGGGEVVLGDGGVPDGGVNLADAGDIVPRVNEVVTVVAFRELPDLDEMIGREGRYRAVRAVGGAVGEEDRFAEGKPPLRCDLRREPGGRLEDAIGAEGTGGGGLRSMWSRSGGSAKSIGGSSVRGAVMRAVRPVRGSVRTSVRIVAGSPAPGRMTRAFSSYFLNTPRPSECFGEGQWAACRVRSRPSAGMEGVASLMRRPTAGRQGKRSAAR